jgi:hypothetical protein
MPGHLRFWRAALLQEMQGLFKITVHPILLATGNNHFKRMLKGLARTWNNLGKWMRTEFRNQDLSNLVFISNHRRNLKTCIIHSTCL